MPAFHLIDYNQYYFDFSQATKKSSKQTQQFVILMESSRGCPFNCTFCCAKDLLGKTWRAKSPKRMLEEIQYLERNYPEIMSNENIHLCFVDNNFVTEKFRIIEFSRLINHTTKYKYSWSCMSRATDLTDRKVIHAMVKSGCSLIYIGAEVGYGYGLSELRKNYKVHSVRDAVRLCSEEGLETIVVSFMIGLPWEKREHIIQTLQYALQIFSSNPRGVWLKIYRSVPYPNTKLWKDLKAKGLLQNEDYESYDIVSSERLVYNHPHLNDAEINLLLGWEYINRWIIWLQYSNRQKSPISITCKELQSCKEALLSWTYTKKMDIINDLLTCLDEIIDSLQDYMAKGEEEKARNAVKSKLTDIKKLVDKHAQVPGHVQ